MSPWTSTATGRGWSGCWCRGIHPDQRNTSISGLIYAQNDVSLHGAAAAT